MAAPPVAGVGVRVLGPLTVELGSGTVGLGGPKQRAVLAILTAGVGRVVPRDAILTGVWGEDASDAHRGSFHTYVSELRAALGDVIVREGNGYRLDIPSEDVDAVAFEQTVEDAREGLASDPTGTADELRDALGMWRGLPYGDLIDVPGLQGEIRRLEELRLTAVELRVEADLAVGRHDALVAELEALAEEHPLRERFRAQHMLALYRCGRQAEALAAFRRTRDLLSGELGLEPSSELRKLEQRILRQDETLVPGVARPAASPVVSAVPGYELREQIGRGAFGVVYRGYQPSVGREVAIKVVRPELASRPGFVRRFESEARMVARLAHPHVVQLIDFWRDPESAYLVMQLLPGGSLLELLSDGGVARSAARRMLHQIGEALDHAHGQGVSHGDLKPSNVLLDDAGNAYLSDFGLAARLLDPRSTGSHATARDYRAPEEAASGPSPAADVFALGVLARQLLDGEGVEAVVARATATNPGDRYPTPASFLADLDAALGEEPTAVAPTPVSRNPYKGLRAFEEADAADFYGRDELVAGLLAAVDHHRFVAVVGPSGSGKSSAVQAGLLPALVTGGLEGSQHWFRVAFTPGTDPVRALVDALGTVAPTSTGPAGLRDGEALSGVADRILGGAEGELLLVVDQFEELFTLVDDVDRRAAFLDLLADAVEDRGARVRVVVTLRADFYDRPLVHDRLGRLVRDGLVTVLPPTRGELVDIVTRPADAVGLRWEPGLGGRIVDDVADQPGALPLLQYCLTELVDRRGGDVLTAEDYDRVGGVEAALATRAENVFDGLSSSQQRALHEVMLRLVTVDEDKEATRRRVRRSELEALGLARPDLDAVLATLTVERLLLADRDPVTRGPTVEVAHEALLRGWPRLGGWIHEQRDSLVLGRRFRAAMADWDRADRDDDHLLTGTRLAPFVAWADTWALTGDERAFYDASRAKDDADRVAQARRRRTLTSILATAAVVATVLASVAVAQSRRARSAADRAIGAEQLAEAEADRATQEADRANREAEIARARELAASAINVLDDDPSLSKLLALAATSITDPPLEVISTLHRAYAADRVVALRSWPERSSLWGTFHPSGESLVAAGAGPGPGASDSLEVLDLDSGEVLWSHRVDGESVGIGPAFFTPDGEEVVAGIFWTPVGDPPDDTETREQLGIHVWNASTGAMRQRFDVGACGGLVAGASAAGLLIRALPGDGACRWRVTEDYEEVGIEFLDLRTGERRVLAERGTVSVDDAPALSADGQIAAFDTADGGAPSVRVVETATGDTILEFDPSGGDLGVRALNHDGSLLVYGDLPLRIWDVHQGEVVASFDGHPGNALSVVFDASGRSAYSTGGDAALRHWDPLSGEELDVFPGVGSGQLSLVNDGHVHLTDPDAHTATVVDVRPGHRGELGALETCPGFTAAATLSVVGDLALLDSVCHGDFVGTTHVWNLPSGDLLHTLPGHAGQALSVSPDGSRFARQEAEVGRTFDDPGWYGGITIRDLRSGATVVELDGLCTWEAAPTPPRAECGTFPQEPFGIWAGRLGWSPDGSMIAALDHPAIEGYLAVWDALTGRLLYAQERPDGSFGYQSALFSPDSERLFAAHAGAAFLDVISTETWELLARVPVDGSIEGGNFLGLVGFADEATLIGVGGFIFTAEAGGTLVWFDPNTLEVVRTRVRIHDGTVKSMALSADGTLLATGAADGFTRVWDARTGDLVHEIPLGDTQVQGVAFVDEHRLAVAPQEGNLLIFAIDTDGLLEIVRSSLTRGFTEAECARFNFGDDCPSLEEMRGR